MDPTQLGAFAALGAALEPAMETQIAKVPPQYRWMVPVAVAGTAAAAHAYATGTPWQSALWNGVAAAAGSMVKHDAAPASAPASAPLPAPVQAAATAAPLASEAIAAIQQIHADAMGAATEAPKS